MARQGAEASVPQGGIGLIFHGIGTPGRTLEPGEQPYWLDTATFETILDRIAASPLRRTFRLSFDDGNASDHDIALPRLAARGLTADFFVLTGRIGQPGSLSADQVLALQSAGMRIGSHGIGHLDLRLLDDPALAEELSASRQALEQICGRPVTALGIPFGAYDRRVLQAVRAAGYEEAFSSDRGRMRPGAFPAPRTSLVAGMTSQALEATLAGRLSPLVRLRRAAGRAKRRWF